MKFTKDDLHEMFEYKDGELFWKKNRTRGVKAGDKAGTKDSNGYLKMSVFNTQQYGHRIIWMMHYGYMPKMIDHIDGNQGNNKIENLREATYSQNVKNRKKPLSNTSGIKNVYFLKSCKKWRVQAKIGNKIHGFGSYKHKEIAAIVSVMVRHKFHGEFANHA